MSIERNRKIVKINDSFYKTYKHLAVFLSRYVPFILFIPAMLVRMKTNPNLFWA